MCTMEKDFDFYERNVLVIGSGAAGARCAIELDKNDVEVFVVSKRSYGDAHTTWARGGINAALGSLDSEDSWKIHAVDTLKEGHFINNPEAVRCVAENMPTVIRELEEWGLDFDKTDSGEINQRYFGAQSYRRTCFVGDRTGEAIMDTLVETAKEQEIEYKDDLYITDLLRSNGRVCGAMGYDMTTGSPVVVSAKCTVVAAGGHTAIYNRHSSREDENNGDGVALAYDAGAELMDMEFVQFHPTGMSGERYGEKWDGRLVTEAVRGEGGRLYNELGERFMEEYSPEKMELDARDIVARAIETEIREERGTKNNAVYLDISHRDEEFIKDRLPTMYSRFKQLGVNIAEEPMEVAPTAHYIMGGVNINPATGETNVSGLRAIGETTAGVHGANRLGGNSLAETLAIGKLTGQSIAEDISEMKFEENITSCIPKQSVPTGDKGEYAPEELISELQRTMEKNVGIQCNKSSLEKALEDIQEIEEKLEDVSSLMSITDRKFESYQNLLNMLLAAKATTKGALYREESRGAHYRTDNPEMLPEYKKNLIYTKDSGSMTIKEQSVKPVPSYLQDVLKEGHELDYHHLE